MAPTVKAPDAPASMHCLVIQLGQAQEVLQSLMALRAVKELYPQIQITFVVKESTAAPVRRVHWIEQIVSFPENQIIDTILSGQKSEAQGLCEVAKWLRPLVQNTWDLLVNWSYNESSSFLTGLLPARIKLGYSRQKDLSFANIDGWSQFLQALERASVSQNIHFTDILTTQILTVMQIHFGEPSGNSEVAVTSRGFFSSELDDLVGLNHLAHSQWIQRDSSRRWLTLRLSNKGKGIEFWCSVISRIFQRHPECNLVLVGGEDVTEISRNFTHHLLASSIRGSIEERILNLTGMTANNQEQFDLLTAVLGGCHWLFCEPCEEAHIAAILGTRVLCVMSDSVDAYKQGPYGNGHYLVRGKTANILPESVYGAWAYGASEWSHRRQTKIEKHFSEFGWSAELSNVQIHRSKIRNSDEGGGVFYELLNKSQMGIAEWSTRATEHLGRIWYCGWAPKVSDELSRDQINRDLIIYLRELKPLAEQVRSLCEKAESYAIELFRATEGLKSDRLMTLERRQCINQIASKMKEIDDSIIMFGNKGTVFLALSSILEVMMHNLLGSRLRELGQEAALAYRHLQEGAKQLVLYIDQTLQVARPVRVNEGQVVVLETSEKRGNV